MNDLQLISDTLARECEALIGLCFAGNRIMDRIKSVLGVKFVMPVTANYIHLNMAHKMPELADEIGDYLESRNFAESYPATIADYSDYSNSRECFDKILEFFIDLERSVKLVIDKCIDEGDKMTMKFLHDFLLEINKYTALALLFCDLSEKYGHTPKDDMQLDSNIRRAIRKAKA